MRGRGRERRSRSEGERLDGAKRRRAERALGVDLSNVVIERNSTRMSTSSALAETEGDHIAFAPRAPQPGTTMGDVVLAHELAHVAQQRGGDVAPIPHGRAEADADQAVPAIVGALAPATDGSGTTLGINADDHTLMGPDMQEALSADGSPPTMVLLGGCSSSDLDQYVQGAGVPIAVGITENVSNAAGAGGVQSFLELLAEGKTLAEATNTINQRLSSASPLLNPRRAQLTVRYAEGYTSAMTLEEARARHRSTP